MSDLYAPLPQDIELAELRAQLAELEGKRADDWDEIAALRAQLRSVGAPPSPSTDREQIEAMLARAGIVGDTYPDDEIHGVADLGAVIKVLGVDGFHAVFYFHEDGSLEAIGAWE